MVSWTVTLITIHTIGTLDEHMHLLLPALIRLFEVDASVAIRRAAFKTLTRLIPRVQVSNKFLLVNKLGRNYSINLFILYYT